MSSILDRSRPGVWISAGAHGALALAALLAFSTEKMPDADEGIPVEVITDNQFSEMTKGEKAAKQVQPAAKPRADRVADAREIRDPGEAKRDIPSPPTRPAEVKTADEDTQAVDTPPPPPPPPVRTAQLEPTPAAAPPPPSRPDTAKADAAKAEAAAKADAAAKAEAAAKAQAEAKADAAERLAEQKEAEAIENAKREAAAKAAAAKAQAQAAAKAKADAAAKAEAEADAKAEAKAALDAKMKAVADSEAKAEKAKAEAERQKQIADAKAKAEADAQAKADADAKAKAKAVAMAKAKADAEAKARKQAELADKFNAGDISKLLASKETSQSSGATGREVQKTASLGTATGASQRMNPSQRDQLVGLLSEQLHKCWQVPIAAQSADKPPVPSIRVKLNQDGTLAGEPVVMNSGDGLFRTVADSATRATRRCAPLKIPAQFAPFYQDWRDLVVNFDPRDMG